MRVPVIDETDTSRYDGVSKRHLKKDIPDVTLGGFILIGT